jgi:hypothetical protein
MATQTTTTTETTMTTLQIGDSTRGFTTVTISRAGNCRKVEMVGLKYLCRRMLRAWQRGETTVTTSAGDELAITVL